MNPCCELINHKQKYRIFLKHNDATLQQNLLELFTTEHKNIFLIHINIFSQLLN